MDDIRVDILELIQDVKYANTLFCDGASARITEWIKRNGLIWTLYPTLVGEYVGKLARRFRDCQMPHRAEHVEQGLNKLHDRADQLKDFFDGWRAPDGSLRLDDLAASMNSLSFGGGFSAERPEEISKLLCEVYIKPVYLAEILDECETVFARVADNADEGPQGKNANILQLFPNGQPSDKKFVEFVMHMVRTNGERRSFDARAQEFTGESTRHSKIADSYLSRLRREIKAGNINFTLSKRNAFANNR